MAKNLYLLYPLRSLCIPGTGLSGAPEDGHEVIAMEDYVATDQRPLQKCLQDVAHRDLYVGIFAWRYG